MGNRHRRKDQLPVVTDSEGALIDTDSRRQQNSGAVLGFEETLWATADKLRGQLEASEYKHLVLGLVFLKFINDVFAERQLYLRRAQPRRVEDPKAYTAANTFWVPKQARWQKLVTHANRETLGTVIDTAMKSIERANRPLRQVLPTIYESSTIDSHRLAELTYLIDRIGFAKTGATGGDILGRVYEYFLGRFASAEGKAGGEFYTPQSVVRLLVEMIRPFKGSVYDPCCGSGGMFVQSEEFVVAHGGHRSDISIYGQESNSTTWRLCKMNLAIRGMTHDIGPHHADSLHNDLHAGLRADFILANPPFNVTDWGGERLRRDPRWKFGTPPSRNANFAWIQHFIARLGPSGVAGFVLANGSLSSNTAGEGEIRRALIESDLVDCIVSLPSNLFYTTQIPVSLWFIAMNKSHPPHRDRHGEVLFIDARSFGVLTDRIHRALAPDEIRRIADGYNSWKDSSGKYVDIPGFARSATLREIRSHRYALVPGRYVGFARSSREAWDASTLKNEIEELEARLRDVAQSSQAALDLIKRLLNG